MNSLDSESKSPLAVKRGGFYMIYAVLFLISIGMACIFYMRQSFASLDSQSSLHAKAQLDLYARSVKEMSALCLKSLDFSSCKEQDFLFLGGYSFHSALSQLDSETFLLDIYGSVPNPASSNVYRITRRFVLIRP